MGRRERERERENKSMRKRERERERERETAYLVGGGVLSSRDLAILAAMQY